jgi:hypothetical protein
MRWAVDWSPASERDVLNMPWRLAARICEAMIVLAERGVGDPEGTERPGVMRLRVPGAVALFRPELAQRTLYVLRIHATK